MNSESSDNEKDDQIDDFQMPELSYDAIMKKYKALQNNDDSLYNHHRKQSSIDFVEKEQLEKSIKLSEAQIDQYKVKMEKENEDNLQLLRKSNESDRFRMSLTGDGGDTEFNLYLDNLKEKLTNQNVNTLDYSMTSRRESDFRQQVDTDQSYISQDESLKRADQSIRYSPRNAENANKDQKSPGPSKSKDGSRKRSPSPNLQLKSPSTNANIIYDKFVKHENISKEMSNHQRDQKNELNEDIVSPLRGKNLNIDDIPDLHVVNEENMSKEITPSRR